jgi:hypothetical protein
MWEFALVALAAYFLYNLRSIHIEFRPKKIDEPKNDKIPRSRRLQK